eukprot:7384085-Prymnesium_polylepis.1
MPALETASLIAAFFAATCRAWRAFTPAAWASIWAAAAFGGPLRGRPIYRFLEVHRVGNAKVAHARSTIEPPGLRAVTLRAGELEGDVHAVLRGVDVGAEVDDVEQHVRAGDEVDAVTFMHDKRGAHERAPACGANAGDDPVPRLLD